MIHVLKGLVHYGQSQMKMCKSKQLSSSLCCPPCHPSCPCVPLPSTYISFWYWHHFLMPKAIRKLQKRSRTATTVGQGKRLSFAFLTPPGRDIGDRAQPNALREEGNLGLLPVARCSPLQAQSWWQPSPKSTRDGQVPRLRILNSEHCSSDLWT